VRSAVEGACGLAAFAGGGDSAQFTVGLTRTPLGWRIKDNFNGCRASILDNLRDGLLIVLRPNPRVRDVEMDRLGIDMGNFWANWLEAVRFACEAQGVISARLVLFASGGPDAAAEAQRMICEKVVAFSAAQIAAELALADGLGIDVAAERAYLPLRHCVHANSDRLGLALH